MGTYLENMVGSGLFIIMCLPDLISVAIKILRDTLSDFFSIFPPKCLPYQWPDKYLEKYIEPAFYEETQPVSLMPNTTQSITLTDLANTFKHSPVVVKGMAGSGKTRFVHRLAYLWAQGKLLQQFSLLFLLSLDSTPALQHLKDLSRLIQVYLPFGEESSLLHEIANELIKMKDNKVLIIVDGWDENIAENCIVSQVVKRHLLPSASLLITCRPGAHSELDKYRHCMFSLLPLNLDQIMSIPSLGSQSISLLRAYSELRSTCEIPYFLNSLNCQTTDKLCPTLSTLLQLLLNCFMKQCSSRLGLSHETLYDFLCKAAVRIDESKDQKITASEMEQLCNAHNLQMHTVNSIGVFVTSTECSFPVVTTFYHFLPDSLRVFLHAKEAAKDEHHRLTPEAVCSTFGQLVCGCNGLNATDKQLFREIEMQSPAKVLGVFRCIFEAQSVCFATHVAMLLDRKVDFSQTHLSLADCFALGYVIAHSGGDRDALWTVLLQECALTNEHIFALFAKDFPIITHRRLANSLETLE